MDKKQATQNALEEVRCDLARKLFDLMQSKDQIDTPVSGLSFFKYNAPTEPACAIYEPCLCLVVQGAKRVVLGEESYIYDANHYLITSVGLPTISQVIEASQEKPLLGLIFKIDLRIVARLIVDSSLPALSGEKSKLGMAVSKVNLPLLEAFERLIALLDTPEDIPVLAPLICQEIFYRLLIGEQGSRLRQIASSGNSNYQIARAIDWLRENYAHQLRVESLAKKIGMSSSTFHQHFRAVTAMSPLQYQKQMRLHEARRLMLSKQQDATGAALLVGYESASQFSREYKRQFGQPPLRDIKKLQETTPPRLNAFYLKNKCSWINAHES